MKEIIPPARRLHGELAVPGDKSISHRALLFGALADGDSRVANFLRSGDCDATLAAVGALGVQVEDCGQELLVHGRGIHNLKEPEDVLNCLGSGTTMRMLAGLLSGYKIVSVLTGTPALRRRPMGRVIEPLREMGAVIWGRQGDHLPPLCIRGGSTHGIRYNLPVASAQVKSAILLAGLNATGETIIIEPERSRDHSERMLKAMGAQVKTKGLEITIAPVQKLTPVNVTVPGDLSSAAFFIAAALLVPDAEVMVLNVGVNPTRTGFLDIVRAMGGDIHLENRREINGEPVADILARSSSLKAVEVSGATIPLAIDELPLVAVLATQAEGTTVVRDAAELHVKESDRIASVVAELRKLGANIEGTADGYIVEGSTKLRGATVETYADHRLAMSMAVAALTAESSVTINDAQYADDSFPGFFSILEGLRQ